MHSYYCQLRREHLNSGHSAKKKIRRSFSESLQFLKEPLTPNPTIGNLASPPSVSSQGMASAFNPNGSKKRRDEFGPVMGMGIWPGDGNGNLAP